MAGDGMGSMAELRSFRSFCCSGTACSITFQMNPRVHPMPPFVCLNVCASVPSIIGMTTRVLPSSPINLCIRGSAHPGWTSMWESRMTKVSAFAFSMPISRAATSPLLSGNLSSLVFGNPSLMYFSSSPVPPFSTLLIQSMSLPSSTRMISSKSSGGVLLNTEWTDLIKVDRGSLKKTKMTLVLGRRAVALIFSTYPAQRLSLMSDTGRFKEIEFESARLNPPPCARALRTS
mmetsp:Transcript_23848/g.46850  ORF Transcript_23848/g.46850 Transcript_23848/m.46850 type:complete len:232 (-) Transcript_23848:155-850(-)